jgi:hypothetical protein
MDSALVPTEGDAEVQGTGPNNLVLDVDLLPTDRAHLCVGVNRVVGGVEILAYCRPSAFNNLAAVYAVSERGRHILFHQLRTEESSEKLTAYVVYVPAALIVDTLSFEVQDKRGDFQPAFMAGMRKLKLPRKWRFAPYYLTLRHEPKALAKGKVAPDIYSRAFVRSIEMVDNVLTIDVSLFLTQAGGDPPVQAEFLVSKDGSADQVFHTSFALSPAKKVFRAPVKLHKYYTTVDVFHGQIELPVVSAFDDAAVYDIRIRIGESTVSVTPYNRYYYEKQSAFVIWTGTGAHTVHHFADPATGAVRFSFQ